MNNTSRFGGKGNGLVWLMQNRDLGFEVPEFDIIDTSYYEDVMKQPEFANLSAVLQARITGQQHVGQVLRAPKRLEDKCLELAERFKGKDVMVRSSGLISEDSDKHSGAGIYDSFKVESSDLIHQALLKAAVKVYSSLNNERAVRYRQENGLTGEKMAVVVQEFAEGNNGVIMSRLPARAGIIPVSWSAISGAVVQGNKDAVVHRAFLTPHTEEEGMEGYKVLYMDENSTYRDLDFVEKKLLPITEKLKLRYGKEFEAEFTMDEEKGKIYLLQIRPLTNIQDIKVKFPDKKPIFTAELCMGVGEYIGPWATTVGMDNVVGKNWDEPPHYAYIASRTEKTIQESLGGLAELMGRSDGYALDYDKETPNKKAIVLTHQAIPGMHALTVANEKGILCLARDNEEEPSDEFMGHYGMNRAQLGVLLGGTTILDRPKLDIPLDEVGEFVHVVSDGLRGHVYQATGEEAREFDKRLLSSVTYTVDFKKEDQDPKWWDYRLIIVPSNLALVPSIGKDFLSHIKERCKKKFYEESSPAGNSRDLRCDEAEFEVFTSWYDPEKKKEGVDLSTGRSVYEVAKKEEVRGWFEEFAAKYKQGYVPK